MCEATTLQFAVGAAGTGAPWHWHRNAFNLLLRGKKRWKLRPPPHAAVARTQLSPNKEATAFRDGGECLEIVQGPGDVVYVPFRWGHEVQNEGEGLAVCVAIEFVLGTINI